jgi:malate dehydrogenase (oxaloacetate-decarboxylating)
MEGKAVLYDQMVGVSALPLMIDASNVIDFVETVARVSPGLAAIHLEDIRSPDCFEIEARLRERVAKPVFHDDQHGTATAVLAALISAARLTDTQLRRASVGVIGLGAAGTAIASLAVRFGVGEVLVHDPDPEATRRGIRAGGKPTALDRLLTEVDVVIAATGRARLISPELLRRGQIVFALSNPVPEIEPALALAAGASLASDGRSVNNALAFPGLVRGALAARARAITPEMMIDAARVIACRVDEDELLPAPLDRSLHAAVSSAVSARAVADGLAGTAAP